MEIENAPTRKARIVVVTKSKMRERYKNRRKKISKRKEEEKLLKKALEAKKTGFKKKAPVKVLYEYLTNNITEDREAEMSRRRRKRRGARNPYEERLLELEKDLDKFWDPFLEGKDMFEIRKNYDDLSMGKVQRKRPFLFFSIINIYKPI